LPVDLLLSRLVIVEGSGGKIKERVNNRLVDIC
jgi:hypothetical protein